MDTPISRIREAAATIAARAEMDGKKLLQNQPMVANSIVLAPSARYTTGQRQCRQFCEILQTPIAGSGQKVQVASAGRPPQPR
jgi:hypothetical protein